MLGRLGCGTHEKYKRGCDGLIIDPYWTRLDAGMKTVEALYARSLFRVSIRPGLSATANAKALEAGRLGRKASVTLHRIPRKVFCVRLRCWSTQTIRPPLYWNQVRWWNDGVVRAAKRPYQWEF